MDNRNNFTEEFALKNGKIQPPWGSDFFIFPKTMDIDFPPFLVGRPYWDNWMIYYFRKNKIPVIDITDYALVFHQNHDYEHVPKSTGHKWEGPEADHNKTLIKEIIGHIHPFNLRDVNHTLSKNGLVLKKTNFRILSFDL